MPFSMDPQPAENETECARCGAHVYIELSRCPECGVNLYEPEDEPEGDHFERHPTAGGVFEKIGEWMRGLLGKPYAAEDVFGDALDLSILYGDLLSKVGGDDQIVDRLIEFERQAKPDGSRKLWIENAIQRWKRDNRSLK
ncbi:MAG: hypothetical protein ABFS03_11805 [Chloroflexota bacterium]